MPNNFSSTHWMRANELEFDPKLCFEWDSFRSHLIQARITLFEKEDKLTRGGLSQGGDISTKEAYDYIFVRPMLDPYDNWLARMWTWEALMKLKYFTWLPFHNRILTWDNLVKRGFLGPSICTLYRSANEDATHIFLDCPFALLVLENVTYILKISLFLDRDCIIFCLRCWSFRHLEYKSLILYTFWEFGVVGMIKYLCWHSDTTHKDSLPLNIVLDTTHNIDAN